MRHFDQNLGWVHARSKLWGYANNNSNNNNNNKKLRHVIW